MSEKEGIPLLSSGPALIFVLIFVMGLFLLALLNYQQFSFEGFNLFTLLWTWLLLLIIHTILNLKNFRVLIRSDQNELIFKSYSRISLYYAPYLIIALIYDNWRLFQNVYEANFPVVDHYLMNMDAALFGTQPTIWLQKLLHPIAVDYFMIAYSMFIIYPFFYLIYLIQKNELKIFQKVLLAQNIAIVFSLISFLFLPAMGPRVHLAADYNTPLQGVSLDFLKLLTGSDSFFQLQYDGWNFIERVKTDCMPSMHAGLCLLVLIYALKYRHIFKRKNLVVSLWLIGIISLIISTIYLRYHWVIDVLAGLILAIIIYYVTELIYKKWSMLLTKKNIEVEGILWITAARQITNKQN